MSVLVEMKERIRIRIQIRPDIIYDTPGCSLCVRVPGTNRV